MENLDSLAGAATGAQEIASVPSTESSPEPVTPGGSAPASDETPATNEGGEQAAETPEAPKPLTRAEVLAHLKALPPEERAAFSKDARTIEEVNAEYQRDLATKAATARQQIEKTVRDEAELRAAVERDYAYFQTDQGKARLLSGDPNVAARHAEVLRVLSQQAETPIRARMEGEFIGAATENAKAGFESVPELKWAADHFEEISKDLSGSGPERVGQLFVNALAGLAKQQRAQIERDVRAEMDAKIKDGVAERVQGTDEPVLVGAGGSSLNGYATLADARKAHNAYEITDDQMRGYIRKFGHE